MFNFFKSTYSQLISEESKLPRPSKKIEIKEFEKKILKPRADFKKKVENAFRNKKITKEQFDELIVLIGRNAINQ